MTTSFILRDDTGRDRLTHMIGALNLDKPWSFSWGPHKKQRSRDQNALMWVITTAIADHTGHSKDEMHSILTRMFLRPVTAS